MSNAKTLVEVQTYSLKKRKLGVVLLNNEPHFLLSEVCRFLDIQNPSDAKKQIDEDDVLLMHKGSPEFEKVRKTYLIDTKANQINVITESGLYSIVMRSKKAMDKDHPAYRFKKWVTQEVLPTIRKTGTYSRDTNGSPGPAYNDFTRPRTPAGEVEVYSPPMTVEDGIRMMHEFFKEYTATMPTMVASIVNGKGKNSLANQIKRRIRVAVAEETAFLKEHVKDLEGHVDDLIDDANDKLDRLKKLTARMSKLEKIARAAVDQGNMTKNELNNLVGEFTAFRKSMKKVVGPVKKEKPIKKKGRTIN